MSVIQCWNCGTRLTLCERSDNDGDCLECGVEIALDDYLADAMTERDALAADNKRLRELLAVYMAAAKPDWRAHSVNYAKGEKCPETIETLQAAWDRDQELINDMRHEIARHKTRINRLEQLRPTAQAVKSDAELVELLSAASMLFGPLCTDSTQRDWADRIDAKLAELRKGES